jgi:hypothetical protein
MKQNVGRGKRRMPATPTGIHKISRLGQVVFVAGLPPKTSREKAV